MPAITTNASGSGVVGTTYTANSNFYTSSQPISATWGEAFPSIATWTIGYDHQLKQLEEVQPASRSNGYPPYNIRKTDDENYQIEMAIAGFAKEEVEIKIQESVLTIKGTKEKDDNGELVYKGIAQRDFSNSYLLAEYVKVKDATLRDGVLTVKLERELPEEKRSKTIKIN